MGLILSGLSCGGDSQRFVKKPVLCGLSLPEIASLFTAGGQDLSRSVLEALAADGYRRGT